MSKYWRFLFGNPAVCGYPFTGVVYPVGKTGPGKKQNLQMMQQGIMHKGDFALLYCSSLYPGHRQKVVGYGEITSITRKKVDEWDIHYNLRQFSDAVKWKQMLVLATALDAMRLWRGKRKWVLEVESDTFHNIVRAGRLAIGGGEVSP